MIYLFALGILLCLESLYFSVADYYNIIDKPNERSSHRRITLRGGGIVFYGGMLLYSFVNGFTYPWFILGLTLITGVSMADDIRNMPVRIRVLIHFLSMLLMFFQWNLFTAYPLWYVLIALVLFIGIINAYNFMDGINGMTGGYNLVVITALIYVNQFNNQFIDPDYLYMALIAVVVFNVFNFRKTARCFAGDVGSISMAFIVLFALGKLMLYSGNYTYILFLAIYGTDSVLTILHRLILRENIFQAHRKHVYQIMANELQIPHLFVTGGYMFLQSVIVLGTLIIPFSFRWIFFCLVLGVLCTIYILFMKKYYSLHASQNITSERAA